MTVLEQPLTFDCAGEKLIGVLTHSAGNPTLGIIVIVGGPQYRVGSHRQFVLLARALARDAIPVMRFDYRGMGDSTGRMHTFEHIVPDIAAAIEAFMNACPTLTRIVLWGLCDAASAGLLYWQATSDARIAGMVLLNPWVRSEESLARARVKHYYGRRLLEREFWAKLLGGKLDVTDAFRGLGRTIKASRRDSEGEPQCADGKFQDQMASAIATFTRPVLLILSGRDLTAKEFIEYTQVDSRWKGILDRPNVEQRDLPAADHTFSSVDTRGHVERLTSDWLKRSFCAQQQ